MPSRTTAGAGRNALHRRMASGWGALVLLVAGCAEPPAMTVGAVGYSESDLRLLTPAQRDLLADLTSLGLLVAEGRTDELAAPFIEREARSLMLQRLAMEVAVQEAGMDDAVLRQAYARAPQPELIVRHLVVLSERWRPEAHRDSARALAEEALARARSGEPFQAVAAEYSDEPGAAERGGLLTPGRAGSWVPEFWEAAASLQEGEISDVVETEYGFHIIKLEERRAVPFEEVRGTVLERFVNLPAAVARAQEWVESRAVSLRVDTAAVSAWRAAHGSTAHASPADTVASAADLTLLTWETADTAGALTASELERYLVTGGSDVRAHVRDADLAATLALVETAAQSGILEARARARGLEPSIAQRAALERRWATRIAGWAETFGFAEGMGAAAVKAASVEALGSPRQAAAIARGQLESVSGVLRTLVPVSAPAAQSSSSADAVNSETSG